MKNVEVQFFGLQELNQNANNLWEQLFGLSN